MSLLDPSYEELQRKVDALENAITANDEHMHELQNKIEGLEAGIEAQDRCTRLLEHDNEKLKEQKEALTDKVQFYIRRENLPMHGPPIIVGENINSPDFYFIHYRHAPRSHILLDLMSRESILFRFGLIRSAGEDTF
jgi:hypothetical protein